MFLHAMQQLTQIVNIIKHKLIVPKIIHPIMIDQIDNDPITISDCKSCLQSESAL